MIDHLTLTVRDYARSRAFYEKVLAPLGYGVVMEFDGMCGFGDGEKPYLWMKEGDPPSQPMHLAFMARRRADVDAFYAAATGAGARGNGPPGVRKDYHPTYYASFVFDPDGHPIEAVNHREERAARRVPRVAAKRAGKKKAAKKAPAKRRKRARAA